MKYFLLIVLLFSSCSTYVSETKRRELDQEARKLFPGKQINGTRVTRDKERYFVAVDVAGERIVMVRCQKYQNNDGWYWKCQQSIF